MMKRAQSLVDGSLFVGSTVHAMLVSVRPCTVPFCIRDGDDFVFTTHDRWLNMLDGFDIEVIHANLSDKRFRFFGERGDEFVILVS